MAGSIPAKTKRGGSSSGGGAAGGREKACVSTTTGIDEATDVDDEAKTGTGWRDSCRGIHAADEVDPGRACRGNGCSAQARQRVVQEPPERDRGDRADPRARI